MTDEMIGNEQDKLRDSTRGELKRLSRALLRMHKVLLDRAKDGYELKHGRIANVATYFQLVIDDPHFAWLRKISALVALIDEAVSTRREATETAARALFGEALALLSFEDPDETFNARFQAALQAEPAALDGFNESLSTAEKGSGPSA